MTAVGAPQLDLSSARVFAGRGDGVVVHVLAPPETTHGPDFDTQCEALADLDFGSVHAVSRRLAFLGMAFCVVAVDAARRRVALASGASNALRLYFRVHQGHLLVGVDPDRLAPPAERPRHRVRRNGRCGRSRPLR
jgi:hypothetical protein